MIKRRAISSKKASAVPPGFKQISIMPTGGKKAHTYIECSRTVTTAHGTFPCSFSVRKDTIPKGDLEKALEHRCFTNTLDQFVKKKARRHKE